MIPIKTFVHCFLLLLTCTVAFAQEPASPVLESPTPPIAVDSSSIHSTVANEVLVDTVKTQLDSVAPLQKNTSIAYPPPFKDYRRLGYNSCIYVGATVVAFGVLWAMPESVTNWDKEEMKEKGILWKWKENVKAGPVWDEDDWVLNYITHPYCGGIYYMTARSSGFSIFESFGYSAIMSTFFWEYGIEAFAEIPSIQDLIITPVLGSVVGEGFFYAKKSILRHDHKILKSKALGYTALVLMDPFNTILDGFGYQSKVKTQMNIAPVGVNQFSKTPVWGVNFSASF
ncbi:DUF3943 domain-containing protein [Flavobacterium limnophilum]|uniref:DUF3943 domain-containing protein n=1 Tax=Flavobacterium limnophilum TaxID=3003262 RepID=UPI0024831671|nr:DUF3943 domain-containing protein [Flavobacterium limnophilum]